MENLTNIAVAVDPSYPYSKRASASWDTEGARFHVWFDVQTNEISREYGSGKLIIYKNPPLDLDRKDPSHFNTRFLDGDKPCNAEILLHVFGVIDRDGLIAKGIAEATKREEERQAASKEADRQERIKEAGPKLVKALRNMVHLAVLVPGDKTPHHSDAEALLRELGELDA